MTRHVAWFSCGAASAVASKVAVEKYGAAAEVVYCDTLSTEHPDNARFFGDVEWWLGRKITVIRSYRFASVDEVFEKTRYMAGIAGARCTSEMKKFPRQAFQQPGDVHIFGYTADEAKRARTFERNNPELAVEWPLIEAGITKAECLERLAAARISLPAMYALGFDHNNCLGCVKATSSAYWDRTRRLFPEVFERRARQSREIGARLVRWKGERIFLDELPVGIVTTESDGDIECGPVCGSTGKSGGEGGGTGYCTACDHEKLPGRCPSPHTCEGAKPEGAAPAKCDCWASDTDPPRVPHAPGCPEGAAETKGGGENDCAECGWPLGRHFFGPSGKMQRAVLLSDGHSIVTCDEAKRLPAGSGREPEGRG